MARRSGIVVAFHAAVVVAACTPSGHPEVQGSAAERNAACEACHPDVAREWRESLHRQSHSDPAYQRAFAREPLPFCSRCHAPEADPAAPSPELAALGTGCVTCHGTAGSSTKARPCADCHEFAFPDGKGLMQLTATEHRASGRAATPCADCHMRGAGGRLSHVFPASRDAEMLRRAATVVAVRTEDAVLITLSPRDVGHAFPTGDIFRRLRVEVTGGGQRARAFLQRNTKTSGPDTRPFVTWGPAEVRVPIAAPGAPLAWAVHYDRVEFVPSPDGEGAVVEGSVEVASGTLP